LKNVLASLVYESRQHDVVFIEIPDIEQKMFVSIDICKSETTKHPSLYHFRGLLTVKVHFLPVWPLRCIRTNPVSLNVFTNSSIVHFVRDCLLNVLEIGHEPFYEQK